MTQKSKQKFCFFWGRNSQRRTDCTVCTKSSGKLCWFYFRPRACSARRLPGYWC